MNPIVPALLFLAFIYATKLFFLLLESIVSAAETDYREGKANKLQLLLLK